MGGLAGCDNWGLERFGAPGAVVGVVVGELHVLAMRLDSGGRHCALECGSGVRFAREATGSMNHGEACFAS